MVLSVGHSASLLVEGGGSHTWVAVVEGDRVRLDAKLPSLNTIGTSLGTQRVVLNQLAAALEPVPGVSNALFAVGAAFTRTYLEEYVGLLVDTFPASLRPTGHTYVTNDVTPLLFAEELQVRQLVVIAGTGSGVTARRNFESIARYGAHEYLLGDDGSAYDIGREALRAVIAAAEGRGRPTRLSGLIERRTNGVEIDRFVYGSQNPKQTIADVARDVFSADREGDQVAGLVLDTAADRLTEVCRGALMAVGALPPVLVTFTGSLVTEPTRRLRQRIEERLSPVGVAAFRAREVDLDLMRRTLDVLQSDQVIFNSIAGAVPMVRL